MFQTVFYSLVTLLCYFMLLVKLLSFLSQRSQFCDSKKFIQDCGIPSFSTNGSKLAVQKRNELRPEGRNAPRQFHVSQNRVFRSKPVRQGLRRFG